MGKWVVESRRVQSDKERKKKMEFILKRKRGKERRNVREAVEIWDNGQTIKETRKNK